MTTFKYVLKRIGLMMLSFMVIMTICFVLVKMLPIATEAQTGSQAERELARREALGYNKPIIVQYGIYLRNIFTRWDWGTSWRIDYMKGVGEVISSRMTPTVLLNLYSMVFSIPLGILLGIFAALKKNKWQDHFISFIVMLFISVPSYVYGFILQYFVGYKTGLLPVVLSSLYDAGGSWFTWKMFKSMILPICALSFGTIAGLARFTRAELTESLVSDYMLLARTKGLTKRQATVRHALKNAMVPILPSIISMFVSVLSGSMIIESIFAINGIGRLYLQAILLRDYDVFMACSMLYTVIGLSGTIIVDLSYGFLDPRIRMGER